MSYLDDARRNEVTRFHEKMKWFYDEFKQLFGSKTEFTVEDKALVERLYNQLASTLNQCEKKECI